MLKKIMEHLSKYLCENPRFIKDFKKWLKREQKKKAVSMTDGSYIQKYQCWEGMLNMERIFIFYEWSTTQGSKLMFRRGKELYEFLEKSKITYPDYATRQKFVDADIIYMTCKPGKAELLCETSKEALEKTLSIYDNATRMPTPLGVG